ncbi:hypothetical protein ACX0G7_24470 [Flavitalea antarctica]
MKAGRTGLTKRETIVLLLSFTGLLVLIFVLNKPALYDEDDYLVNVSLIGKYGFGERYLLNHIGSAGPLYPVLHYMLEPITNLRTPHIRLINVFLLIGSIWFIGRTLKTLQLAPSYGLLALAVPMTYVISGLALTEMPAIFFLCAAFYLIIKTCYTSPLFRNAVFQLAVGGLCLSLAILGRQPFLLVLSALPILFLKNRNYLKNSVLLLITIVTALALPVYVFWVWGGLVAPHDAIFYDPGAEDGVSLQPVFFFICMAYYAVVFFIVTPNFYILPSLKEAFVIGILALIAIALNFRYDLFLYLPMKYFIEQIFPPIIAVMAETVCGAILFLAGLYFILTLIRQLIKNKFAPALLFFAVSLILIAISCIKITWGFSSRYPAQALPFMVPMFAYFYREHKFNTYRLGIGGLIGLISFASFMALN